MVWLILLVLAWGFLHSLLASNKIKKLIINKVGAELARWYRLGYNLFALASFLPILVVAAMRPDRKLYLVPLPWSALMAFGEILALVALLAGFRQTRVLDFMGLRQLNKPATVEPNDSTFGSQNGHLVTAGVYRFVRHPLYSAGIVFIWLLPLMTVNVLAINIGLTVYVICGAFFEERKLRLEFGREYADYSAVTPMFIPSLKRNKARG